MNLVAKFEIVQCQAIDSNNGYCFAGAGNRSPRADRPVSIPSEKIYAASNVCEALAHH